MKHNKDLVENRVLPGLVLLEDQLKHFAVYGDDDTKRNLVGFRGHIRDLTSSTATIETRTPAGRINSQRVKPYILLVKSSLSGDSLCVPVQIEQVRDFGGSSSRHTAVSLKLTGRNTQRNRLEKLLQKLRAGNDVYRRFYFPTTVYFGDTNIEGNVYFARMFEWQGKAREAFYQRALPRHDEVRKEGIHIITAEASLKFKSQLRLFDNASIEVKVCCVKTSHLKLGFEIRNQDTDILIAIGYQVLTFSNSQGTLIPVPQKIRRAAYLYFDPYEDIVARL